MSKIRVLYGAGVLVSAAIGCSDGDGGSSAPGAGGAADAGPAQPPVRSSCANMPILDDRWKDTSEACKSCVDSECCDEAQACADNPKCKELWECRARCVSPFDGCIADCNAAAGAPLPIENGPLVTCRNGCAPCIDVTSCSKGPWPAPPKPSYPAKLRLSNFSSGVVFPKAHIKVCKTEDTECQAPVSEGVTDDSGNVDIEVPASPAYTDAYIEVSGPNVQPSMIYVRGYHAQEKLESGVLNLSTLDTATAGALLGSLGAAADQTQLGAVTALAYSCGDRGVLGLTAASGGASPSTIRSYLVRGVPAASATATDGGGGVVFADHPLGPTSVTMTDASGAVFGSADGFVRPGFLTVIYVLPAH